MKKTDFVGNLSAAMIDSVAVKKVQEVYGTILPDVLQRVVSCSKDPIFFDDGCRMLSFQEIIDAEQDLHIDFRGKKIIPVADCGENDFIVYHFEDMFWSKFNINDETIFKKKKTLSEILK